MIYTNRTQRTKYYIKNLKNRLPDYEQNKDNKYYL